MMQALLILLLAGRAQAQVMPAIADPTTQEVSEFLYNEDRRIEREYKKKDAALEAEIDAVSLSSGVQTVDFNAHTMSYSTHGAVATATPNRIALRDASGNLVANGFLGTVDLSTVASALNTKLSSGAVPSSFVDLSTVASALNTKLSSGAIPSDFVNLSTVASAIAGLVPYDGAAKYTDLGAFGIKATSFTSVGKSVFQSSVAVSRLEWPDGSVSTTANSSGGVITVAQIVSTQTVGYYANAHPALPHDNTIPQLSEMAALLSSTITAQSGASSFLVEANVNLAENSNVCTYSAIAIFQDAGAGAICAQDYTTGGAGSQYHMDIKCVIPAVDTNPHVFQLRWSADVANCIYVNAFQTGNIYGQTEYSSMTITEVRQ